MKRLNILKTILITVILLSGSQSIQLTYASDPGTTGANFLKIGVGPRAVGMGEAQVAICNDVTSVFWNPAGLVSIPTQEVSFIYSLWLESISSQYFGYTYPHPTIGTFAGSINYLSMDKIQGYDADGDETGKVTVYDLSGVLSYARELPYGINGGINLKFIQQKLEKESSFAFGVDMGVIGGLGRWLKVKGMEELTVGLNLQNLGSKVKFQKEKGNLPLNFKFGVGLRKEIFGDPLIIAIDGNLPNDNDFYGSLGIEYWVRDLIGLRLGYKSGQDLGNGLSFGGGIKVNVFQLDYALVHFGELGYTHRIGVVTRFGKEARVNKSEARFEMEQLEKEMPREVKIREEERGLVVSIASKVLFSFDKAELKPASLRVLNRVAKLITAYPKNKVSVEGHACSIGTEDYNQKLSEMRAESVASYLIESCNISESRIETFSYGETKPANSNKTAEGRVQNRRVEIVILKQPKLSSSQSESSPLREEGIGEGEEGQGESGEERNE